jgi:hypothetical protein
LAVAPDRHIGVLDVQAGTLVFEDFPELAAKLVNFLLGWALIELGVVRAHGLEVRVNTNRGSDFEFHFFTAKMGFFIPCHW